MASFSFVRTLSVQRRPLEFNPSLSKLDLTKTRRFLNLTVHQSLCVRVTTQMKALDEYLLMAALREFISLLLKTIIWTEKNSSES